MKMKKHLVSVSVLLCVALSACSSTASTDPAATTPLPSDSPVPEIVEQSASPSASVEPSAELTTPFEQFRSSLDDAGYTYEVTTMAAELVGASSGEKYKFDFGTVELYQFDEGSESLAQVEADGGVTLEGFGVFSCELNGNLAAVINVTEHYDDILSIFNSL